MIAKSHFQNTLLELGQSREQIADFIINGFGGFDGPGDLKAEKFAIALPETMNADA